MILGSHPCSPLSPGIEQNLKSDKTVIIVESEKQQKVQKVEQRQETGKRRRAETLLFYRDFEQKVIKLLIIPDVRDIKIG